MKNNYELSKSEIKLLSYKSKGKTIKYAAEKLKIAEKQAYGMSKTIKEKLNARNLTQAVYIAYSEGLLN